MRISYFIFLILPFISTCELSGYTDIVLRNKTSVHENICTYRSPSTKYPESLFTLLSGYGCYDFSNILWLVNNTKLPLVLQNMNVTNAAYPIPTVKVGSHTVYFNVTDEEQTIMIKTLYSRPEYFRKWETCANSAIDCCHSLLNEENIKPTEEYPCPALWDGFTCFPRAKANTTTYMPCPSFTSSDVAVCQLNSEKYCLDNGWIQKTNYETCASSIVYRSRNNFHVIVISLAIAVMFPAVILHFSFEKLRRIKTVIFHRNLILAILIKNVLVIISKTVVILDAVSIPSNNVMNDDGIGCKILAVLESASKNAVFASMTADAFYLHKIIARSFSGEPNMYVIYIFITLGPIIPTLAWAVLMTVYEKGNCWMADSESWFQWITDGYKYAMLGLNVLFLLDILRVLFLKLGKNTNKKQTLSALKATLILLPLFGLPLLVTGQRNLVDMNDCVASQIYIFVTYSIEASQGILMCVFFCYLNKDVQREVKNFYRKIKLKSFEKFGWSSLETKGRRRTTATTYI